VLEQSDEFPNRSALRDAMLPNTIHRFAHSGVGKHIKIHRADGWHNDQWGLIVMVIPSGGKPCWLIEYPDGATDVFPVSLKVSETPDANSYSLR